MKIIPGYPLTAFCLVGSFLFSGCVASYHKITLHDALIDVVDSYDAMHQRQLQLEKERNAADPDHPYQKLGVYPKEVDVTFAVNANGELSGSGSANGGYGPVKAVLTLSGSYKSSRTNTVVVKFGSMVDNDAITAGKVRWLPNGDLWVYGGPGAGTHDQGQRRQNAWRPREPFAQPGRVGTLPGPRPRLPLALARLPPEQPQASGG